MTDRPSPRPRRPRGDGSWGQTKDGRLYWQGSFGYRAGKRLRVKVYGRTRAEVLAKRKALLAQHAAGRALSPERVTLGAFLARWLEQVVAVQVQPSTVRTYAWAVASWTQALGHLRLSQLTPADIQATYATWLQRGHQPSTVRWRAQRLHQALEVAVDWGLLDRNPARRARGVSVPEREYVVLSEAQATALFTRLQGHALELPVRLAFHLGLRAGELAALRWADVDLRAGTLRVRRSTARGPRGGYESRGKTRASGRVLPLPPALVVRLAVLPRAHAYVLSNTRGQPWGSDGLNNAWRWWRRKLGLPAGLRLHDLRHSLASVLLADGAPLPEVAAILGHSSPAITARLYAHLLPGAEFRALRRLSARLQADRPPGRPPTSRDGA